MQKKSRSRPKATYQYNPDSEAGAVMTEAAHKNIESNSETVKNRTVTESINQPTSAVPSPPAQIKNVSQKRSRKVITKMMV